MPSKQLLNIQTDYVFKRVFGAEENKNVLRSFLNAVLKDHPHIESIELRNTEIPQFGDDGRGIRLDIQARIGPSEFIDVEIQCYATPDLKDRTVQYLAHMLVEHRDRTQESSYSHPRVIGVWVLGESCTDLPNPVNRAMMTFEATEQHGYRVLSDKAQVVFIELPKFRDDDSGLSEGAKAWLTFLTDPENQKAWRVKEVRQAYDTLERMSGDPKTREFAKMRERSIMDARSEFNTAVQLLKKQMADKDQAHKQELKDVEEAHQQELKVVEAVHQKQLKEAAETTARHLLALHVDKQTVAQATGLSWEEMDSLDAAESPSLQGEQRAD